MTTTNLVFLPCNTDLSKQCIKLISDCSEIIEIFLTPGQDIYEDINKKYDFEIGEKITVK